MNITKITVTLEDGSTQDIFPVIAPTPAVEEPTKVVIEDAVGTETTFVPETAPEVPPQA